LVLFHPQHQVDSAGQDESLHFILLSTKGVGPLRELELMSEAKPGQPLKYDKLILRRESGMRGGGRDKGSWSWSFNQKFYKDIRESCIQAVRMRDLKRARLLTGRLMSYPGFHGIRAQRASIFRAMTRGAIHAGHSKESLSFIPEKQFWIRKSRKETVPLGLILSGSDDKH
jgi:hypothetical protein